MKTIYLKTPYFNQIKKKKTKFLCSISNDVIQGEKIELRNAQQGITRTVVDVCSYQIDQVPWFVLDDMGFTSRVQFRALLFNLFHRPFLDEITILELEI